jgi:CDP-diacylglycerol--glycerol-3-phosphate 3-phosphatidyltransferase
MKATLREEFLNLPNMLTMVRIIGIPFVMICIWRGEPKHCVIAAWLYSAVCFTDYFDGWLARRRGQVTVLGKFLDPLADKLMVMAMLVMLVALHRMPAWLVVIILAREMTINGLRAIASSMGLIIPAGRLGKLKTALQLIGIMLLLIHYQYTVYFFGLYEGTVNFHDVGMIVVCASVVFSLVSAAQYFRGFLVALDRRRVEDTP